MLRILVVGDLLVRVEDLLLLRYILLLSTLKVLVVPIVASERHRVARELVSLVVVLIPLWLALVTLVVVVLPW